MIFESGMGTTPRARQLMRIGQETGHGLMSEEMIEFSLDGLESLYRFYKNDLGDRVSRIIKVVDRDEESITVEVRLTGYHEAEHRYRVRLVIEEQEPS